MTTPRTEEKARRLSGSCFCKAARYEVEDAFVYAANCHCSDCRRTTGSAFKPFAGIEREKFRLVTDRSGLLIYGDDTAHESSHNGHCARCGSLLYSVVREGAFVHVPMGTLIDTPTIRPDHHIFVGSKAPWFTITDGLPQYREHTE